MIKQEVISAEEYQKRFVGAKRSKGTKFNNTVSLVDTELFGIVKFDSNAEVRRYNHHEKMVAQGHYTVERQVPYDLVVNQVHICKYIADFVLTYPDGVIVVEDVKGFETDAYKLKRKLMLAVHGIEILEIREKRALTKTAKRKRDSGIIQDIVSAKRKEDALVINALLLKKKKATSRKK